MSTTSTIVAGTTVTGLTVTGAESLFVYGTVSGLTVTYERLRAAPEAELAGLCRFLGVADDAATVSACVARCRFERLSGGRPAGTARDGAFLGAGVVGGWRRTLSAAAAARVVAGLGWMYSVFGWEV